MKRLSCIARLTSTSIRSQRGLTLVEIIVVLIILAVLMAFLGSRIFGMGDSARADMTRLKLQDLKQKVYMYQMRNNSLPQDIKQIAPTDDEAKDAWGNMMQFRNVDGGRAYELRSLGGDAREGGAGTDEDLILRGP